MSRLHIQRSEENLLSSWLKKNSKEFEDFEASELHNEFTSTELVFMMLPIARATVNSLRDANMPCGFSFKDIARVIPS